MGRIDISALVSDDLPVLECFDTSLSPDDFVYFPVFPDHLRIQLHRTRPGFASFHYRFMPRVETDRVAVQRVLDDVEGNNKRIRRELGERYAKTSIGAPFAELDQAKEDWVEIALDAFQKCLTAWAARDGTKAAAPPGTMPGAS